MAGNNDNNVNVSDTMEENDATEVTEKPKLSKHRQKKALKNRYAKIKKEKMILKNQMPKPQAATQSQPTTAATEISKVSTDLEEGKKVNHEQTQEKKNPPIQDPLAAVRAEMQKSTNARASVLSDDYLKQGSKTIPGIGHVEPMKPKEEEKKPESKIPSSAMPIPGMRNQNSKAQELTRPEEKPLTEEERLTRKLRSKESYLEVLRNARGGTRSAIAHRAEEIQRTEEEIRELSKSLGIEVPKTKESTLPTNEQIQAERENRKRLQREELQRSERELASLVAQGDVGSEEIRFARNYRIGQLEKNITRLKGVVPENERLPIHEEKTDPSVEQDVAKKKEEPREEPKQEPQNPQAQQPDPVPQKKNLFDFDDDDDETEMDITGAKAQESIRSMMDFAANFAKKNEQNEPEHVAVGPNANQVGNNPRAPQFTEEQKREQDLKMANLFKNYTEEMKRLDKEEQEEARNLQVQQPNPVPKKKNLFDDDDDDETELDITGEKAKASLEGMNDFVANLAKKVVINEPEHDADPNANPVVDNARAPQFTEEQKREQDLKMANLFKNYTEEMGRLDNEEKEEDERLQQAEKIGAERAKKHEERQAYDPIAAFVADRTDESEMDVGVSMFTETVDDRRNPALITDKLASFAGMYKLKVDEKQFGERIAKAWALMKSGDAQKVADGKKMLGDFFATTAKSVFEIEKNASYKEHRMPEFNEIIVSTNELFRAAMYVYTDLYHDPKSESLYTTTAFGGLNAKELAELTAGDSLWKMDQKSDEAWEIQCRDAKDLAEEWLKEDRPYEKMIDEMNAMIDSAKKGSIDLKDTYTKLTAAEWLLINNEKMIVEDPEDPLNPIPNWGNRYWKAITAAREAVGISKHTSMRELIQGNYAQIAKAVVSQKYNETQVAEHILAPDVRGLYDSYRTQMVEFATQSAASLMSKPQENERIAENPENKIRWSITIPQEDEREKIKNEPKVFSNMVVSKDKEIQYDAAKNNGR